MCVYFFPFSRPNKEGYIKLIDSLGINFCWNGTYSLWYTGIFKWLTMQDLTYLKLFKQFEKKWFWCLFCKYVLCLKRIPTSIKYPL